MTLSPPPSPSPSSASPSSSGRLEGVAGRVAAVRARIAAAAAAAGRDPAAVRLVAVAKYQPAAAVRAAVAAGVTDIGENYAQGLKARAAEIDGAVRWHMVGRLQRNKAGVIVATGALLHALDSVELAEALGRRAGAAGGVAEALVQVEVDEREAAHGVRPDALEAFVAACVRVEGLRLRGLMVLPAAGADPRPAFERVAELGRRLGPEMPHLSMGMSADLEAAVEAGATMVRIGTAIFGPRPARGRDHGTVEKGG